MDFLAKTPEAPALNQYWYSERTIAALVEELASGRCGKRVAFLSTPSVYFSLPETSAVRQNSYCFDLDEQWADDPRFRRFDFNAGRVDADLASGPQASADRHQPRRAPSTAASSTRPSSRATSGRRTRGACGRRSGRRAAACC